MTVFLDNFVRENFNHAICLRSNLNDFLMINCERYISGFLVKEIIRKHMDLHRYIAFGKVMNKFHVEI